MSKRRIDPETGKPALTWRESKLADGFVANGGNATRAAVDAGYSPNSASQAAWNVLNRPAVQERIRARFAQAQIEPDEAIGSLVSQMRADVTDCFGPDGSVRTIGHATRIEFLSLQTAAVQLARINAAASAADSAERNRPPDPVQKRVDFLQEFI